MNVENIHVGNWVTAIALREKQETGFWSPPTKWDGLPFQVKAISWPFLGCERDGVPITIDVREVDLTKLTPQYVRFLSRIDISTKGPHGTRKVKIRPKKTKEKRDPRDCPRCGQRMVQRMSDVERLWHRVCPDCGYDQGPVEEARR